MTSYNRIVFQFKPVKPILPIRLSQSAAVPAEKINRILAAAFAEGREVGVAAAASVGVALLPEMCVTAHVHPLVRCHTQIGDLKIKQNKVFGNSRARKLKHLCHQFLLYFIL